jgi:nucleotide-binding universal stress UspA family protein
MEAAVFHSILVAVDGSPAAARALEQAVELARAEEARLTLISVAELPRWGFSGFPLAVPFPNEAELVDQAEKIVERAEALVPEDVPVSTVVRRGPVVREILKRIDAAQHDLVVVGSRGLGPAGSLLLGSVSRAVLARSPVPVLVARAEPVKREAAGAAAWPRRIRPEKRQVL